MQGGDVKKLQRYLTIAGHRARRDGDFGPRTQRALKATEKELELHADGIATRREQRAIRRAVASPGTGGAAYVAPPPPSKVVPGAKGRVDAEGFAIPPSSAPRVVKRVVAAGNKIAKTPYKWGGGHGSWDDTGYDCSGSVSYALHGGGLLGSPLVSGDLASWGAAELDHDLREQQPRLHGRRGHALRHERSLPHRIPLDDPVPPV
jgi:cell wall-associated NlpC family hydrolase